MIKTYNHWYLPNPRRILSRFEISTVTSFPCFLSQSEISGSFFNMKDNAITTTNPCKDEPNYCSYNETPAWNNMSPISESVTLFSSLSLLSWSWKYKTYLERLHQKYGLQHGQCEGLDPGGRLLLAPWHAVEYGEHGRDKNEDENEEPSDVATPERQLTLLVALAPLVEVFVSGPGMWEDEDQEENRREDDQLVMMLL